MTTLILSKLVTWMRRQSGTTDLRALLYMDEVAGYLPPTAMPPTKKPIMTLMKQARAFGVGVVLSTQNPVDVDYKALSNAGTWMIGRLQTEQDKQRLLDGMSAAAGGVDVAAVSRHDRRAGQARVRAAPGGQGHARGVHHPLGDELPPRPADPRPDRDADGRAEGGARSRTGRRVRPASAAPPAQRRHAGDHPTIAPAARPSTTTSTDVDARGRRRRARALGRHRRAVAGRRSAATPAARVLAAGGGRSGRAALRRRQGRPRARRGVRGGHPSRSASWSTPAARSPSTTTTATCDRWRRTGAYRVAATRRSRPRRSGPSVERDLVDHLVALAHARPCRQPRPQAVRPARRDAEAFAARCLRCRRRSRRCRDRQVEGQVRGQGRQAADADRNCRGSRRRAGRRAIGQAATRRSCRRWARSSAACSAAADRVAACSGRSSGRAGSAAGGGAHVGRRRAARRRARTRSNSLSEQLVDLEGEMQDEVTDDRRALVERRQADHHASTSRSSAPT